MKTTAKFLLPMVLTVCAMVLTLTSCGGGDDDPTYQAEPADNSPAPTTPSPPQETLQLMQTCLTCKGTTACVNCNGTGRGHCQRCNGTGKYCSACGSTGKHSACNGTKTCKTCHGGGEEYCDHCTGGVCHTCNGLGWWHSPDYICTTCGGSKKCPYCHGNYKKTCSSCGGSGKCFCGDGLCTTCHGDPTCTTCHGDPTCPICRNNVGKCSECNGTGQEKLSIITFTDSGGDENVFLYSTAEWQTSTNIEWISCSPTSGRGNSTIIVTADKNHTTSQRRGEIVFSSGSSKVSATVIQDGEAPRLTADASSVIIDASGAKQTISISSNTSWTVRADDPWLTCSPATGNGDATVTLSASPYATGTRYTTITISTPSLGEGPGGGLTTEVNVAQTANPEDLDLIKRFIEKPMGVVDVDLKTASYYEIKNAIAQSFVISYESTKYQSLQLSSYDNPTFKTMLYQGLPLSNFSFDMIGVRSYSYSFTFDKSKGLDYYDCINNCIQDFKYNLGVTLTKSDNSGAYYEIYEGRDEDMTIFGLWIRDYGTTCSFEIHAYYKE